MEYLKKDYLGAVAAKIIVENKEEIARMIENGKKETIKEFLEDSPENTNILDEFYGNDFDNVMQAIVTISKYYGMQTYRPEFLLDSSAQYIKESAINIAFNEFFSKEITVDKLKNFIKEFSDDEYDRMIFIKFVNEL
jgi:hypothetical protein